MSDSRTEYVVVVNQEDQYALWPAHRSPPTGWCQAGEPGTKEACLDYVRKVWTDMRPASLRRAMDQP
jgi:MbtH protein